MSTLTLKPIVSSSLLVSLDAVSSSDEFADDGQQRTYYEVNNGSGGSINVTIPVQKAGPYQVPGVGAVTLTDKVIAVANGARRKIGPFVAAYINPNTGRVTVQHSATTTVTGGAFTLAKEVNS